MPDNPAFADDQELTRPAASTFLDVPLATLQYWGSRRSTKTNPKPPAFHYRLSEINTKTVFYFVGDLRTFIAERAGFAKPLLAFYPAGSIIDIGPIETPLHYETMIAPPLIYIDGEPRLALNTEEI